jgi:cephalosporin hydroxylase
MGRTLIELFEKYKGNTCFDGTDKLTTHSYGDIYTNIVSHIEPISPNILEIGIAGGYGIKAFSEYFPAGNIFGIDIEDRVEQSIKQISNINLHFGNALLPETIHHFDVSYDLIIEDASHIPEHQIQHFEDFCKCMKQGGYYIIEDVHEVYFDRVNDATAAIANANGLTQAVYDLRHIKGRFDDILLVFKKN